MSSMTPTDRPAETVFRLYSRILAVAKDRATPDADVRVMLQILSGMLAESALLFDEPDDAMACQMARLRDLLGLPAAGGQAMQATDLPDRIELDRMAERGRLVVSEFLDADEVTCPHAFADLLLLLSHHFLSTLEPEGFERMEAMHWLEACSWRALGYDIAAQELCDVAIEHLVLRNGWSLADCVSGLGGMAGLRLAECLLHRQGGFSTPELFSGLDGVVHVMSQEAVRLGTPAGSDWRFGVAANDCPANPPKDLIAALAPHCAALFRALGLSDLDDQAVACAKAAGRMVAVAAGGDSPEMPPVIAKPLAVSALTETCRSLCVSVS